MTARISTIRHAIALFVLAISTACLALDVAHVGAADAAKLVNARSVIILDVRTSDEFAEGHIAGARNIDFNSNEFEAEAGKLDKKAHYLVHCASGRRSTFSLAVLEKLGFQHVTHLDGGFNAWVKAGLPVAK